MIKCTVPIFFVTVNVKLGLQNTSFPAIGKFQGLKSADPALNGFGTTMNQFFGRTQNILFAADPGVVSLPGSVEPPYIKSVVVFGKRSSTFAKCNSRTQEP